MSESLGVTTESYVADNLIAGDFPIQTKEIELLGENLERGAILGKIAASGKYKLATAAATDGSQRNSYMVILAKDTDASEEDRKTIVYLTGEFNEEQLTFGAGFDADALRDEVRKNCIFLKSPVKK